MPVMNFPDMFPALSSFWFWRGNTGPCSSFSAPSDPFQKIFLHIHRVIVIVDLITKICCRMYKTMCTYCELPPSFPTLPVQQTHEVIVVKKKFLSLLHWKSWKKGGSSQYCFVHLTRCLSTSGGSGKHTDLTQ